MGYLSLCQEVGGEHQDSQKDVAGWHPEAAVSLKQKTNPLVLHEKKKQKTNPEKAVSLKQKNKS